MSSTYPTLIEEAISRLLVFSSTLKSKKSVSAITNKKVKAGIVLLRSLTTSGAQLAQWLQSALAKKQKQPSHSLILSFLFNLILSECISY